MDFLEQQSKIFNYIKDNYKTFLIDNLPEPNIYVDDSLLDFDKYKSDFTLFVGFNYYGYEALSNESTSQKTSIDVFLVVRNASVEELKPKLLRYTTSFFKFFEDTGSNFGGIADYGIIEGITFYPYVEGQKNIKVAEINVSITTETI
jgi:hypothetical protein